MTENKITSQIAEKVLQDQMLLQKLTNRIYELMAEDIRNQYDRMPNYRRTF